MRKLAILACLVLMCSPCFGGSPKSDAKPRLHLEVDETGKHFTYSISSPKLVRKAWLEVLDRPTLLDRNDIQVKELGEIEWNWKKDALNEFEEDEDELQLTIWDPDGETIVCDVDTMMRAYPGGEVSWTTVGARQQLELHSRLKSWSYWQVEQGRAASSFIATGTDMNRRTKFLVDADPGSSCDELSARTEFLDLAHVRITLPRECLLQSGELKLGLEQDQKTIDVFIASSKSPVLQSVLPSRLPAEIVAGEVVLTIKGYGFTKTSEVRAAFLGASEKPHEPWLSLKTEYVSPTELRARVDQTNYDPEEKLGKKAGEDKDKFRIWVSNNRDQHELSQPRDVDIVRDGNLNTRSQTALITSVWPFPIPPLTENSPAELKITVRGENFIPANKVIATFGTHMNRKELRSQYVSPTLMRAWLPRQFWRKHQISFRLVVETVTGERLSKRVDVMDLER